MKTILFLCTGNSCRSQMAEGFARRFFPKDWRVISAGVRADGQNPKALAVMSEIGFDISNQQSKTVASLGEISPDIVITLCDHAKEVCPFYPNATLREHWGLNDPADATGSPEEVLAVYRRVREEIRERVEKLAAGFKGCGCSCGCC